MTPNPEQISTGTKARVDGMTFGQMLTETAETFPDHDALVFHSLDYKINYKQLAEEVDRTAKGLLAMGIGHGDHVAVWATNVPQWTLLQMATGRIGAVLVNINPSYRPFELKYVLNQSDSVALFLVDQFKTSNYFQMINEVCPELAGSTPGQLKSAEYPNLRWVVSLADETPDGCTNWASILSHGDSISDADFQEAIAKPKAHDPVNIQYTSGTTGFPKAAMLTHRNLLLNANYVGECQKITDKDRICIPVPFYHCFGCVMGNLCSMINGAAMVVPAEYYEPGKTLEAIEKHRATAVYGVPTMFILMLQHETFKDRDLSSLRTGIMAGSPCPIEVMRKVISEMGASEVTIAYGLTEASPVITQTRTDDPIELRVETVGRVLPGVEAKILNPETGEEMPDGEQGELCARGHGVMRGYYKNKEATDGAIDSDGWLHSGDLAMRKSNGYFRITGRIKDMIIRGGENVYPREIEEFLFQQDGIAQAAVVGVPDKKFGEEVCAWIRLEDGTELSVAAVRELCKKNMAHYKVPRYVEFVTEYPQTVTGKIQKFKIREAMIEKLGLEIQETA